MVGSFNLLVGEILQNVALFEMPGSFPVIRLPYAPKLRVVRIKFKEFQK